MVNGLNQYTFGFIGLKKKNGADSPPPLKNRSLTSSILITLKLIQNADEWIKTF